MIRNTLTLLNELWTRISNLMLLIMDSVYAVGRRVFDPVEFFSAQQIGNAAALVADVLATEPKQPYDPKVSYQYELRYEDDIIAIEIKDSFGNWQSVHIYYRKGENLVLVYDGDTDGDAKLLWRGQWVPHLIQLSMEARVNRREQEAIKKQQ